MSSSQQQQSQCSDVERFLSPDYHHVGNILKLKDETEFYCTGSSRSKHGVIIIPDTMGWNTGRVRNIADFLAENGCMAAIPRLMGSPKDAEAPSLFETSGFGEYLKGQTFEGNLKPKVCSLVRYMQNEGVEKISLLGFSWGGWVVTNLLASDIADNFVCGALAHPSINLEERMYGGNMADLMSRIDRPILLMPAHEDPDDYKHYLKMMKFKLPTCKVVEYNDLPHGFLLRSSIEDQSIRNANVHAICNILDFFNYHFQANLSDIVHKASEGVGQTEDFTKKAGSSMTDWMRQTGSSISEGTKRMGETLTGRRDENQGQEQEIR